MEFLALTLIAEIGAAFAGFATLAGVIQHDELAADTIFDIVLHSMIAVIFALAGILFASSGDGADTSLRVVAAALFIAASLAILREYRAYQLSWKGMLKAEIPPLGDGLAILGLVCMVVSPLLAAVVAIGVFAPHAPLLYELAVFNHLLAAILFLLHVAWMGLAVRADKAEG